MKKILLFPMLLFSIAANALPNGWVVTVFNQAYNNLSSPIVVPLAAGWDDPYVAFPLGFTHTYAGKSTNTMNIDTNFSVGTDLVTSPTGIVTAYVLNIDAIDRATYPTNPPSTISYKTEGSAGNKIAKIQWKDFGFYGEDDVNGTLNDSANIQMWFYETDNAVEYRFGPSYLDDFERNIESTRLPIGILTDVDIAGFTFDKFYYLSALSPVALDSFTFTNPPSIDFGIPTFPTDSTVIRFSPTWPVSTQDKIKLNEHILFYPTVASSTVNIDFTTSISGGAAIRIIDMSGKLVVQKRVSSMQNKLDVSALATSNYILQVQYEGRSVFYKFTKN